MIPEARPEHTEVMVLYDLSDEAAFERARNDRAAWGRAWSDVHPLDPDRIVIIFRPGGASSALEAAS